MADPTCSALRVLAKKLAALEVAMELAPEKFRERFGELVTDAVAACDELEEGHACEPECRVYREYCPKHGFVHGREAEELREGVRRALEGDDDETALRDRLERLLDVVDARDSLAFVEATGRRPEVTHAAD